MSDPVIVGIITAVAAVVCQIIISISGRSAAQRERAESQRLITYRLDQLEHKMTVHNNMIQRTYKLEQDTEITKEKLLSVTRRLDELEEAIR
ncbi:hypothetical protein [Ruminococcus sp. FC2018]|uniref:hypothetical protein n=1 Tax=Ruminococcus sp. FC2018 TaxID=1410617 RepID=UPI00055B7683|nr:hypothetical protein [Ruminococcus sp. FC2018]